MVGVSFQNLERVNIFNLLGLGPSSKGRDPERLRKAYKKAMLAAHPDKSGPNVKATQLNQLKEFLCNFDARNRRIRSRIEKLFGQPIPASKLGKPGSNPIVIDALEICAPALPAVSSSNPKEKCKIWVKQHRRRRDRRLSEYHPSRESKWRPATYADQSDTDLG